MIAFFDNYSTVAFPLHLPTLKQQQFFGAVANSLGKNSYFPLPMRVNLAAQVPLMSYLDLNQTM